MTPWCTNLLEWALYLLSYQPPGFQAQRAEKPHLLCLLLWMAGKEVRKGLLCASQFRSGVSHSGIGVKTYTQMYLLSASERL